MIADAKPPEHVSDDATGRDGDPDTYIPTTTEPLA